jgi:hypothetical protein
MKEQLSWRRCSGYLRTGKWTLITGYISLTRPFNQSETTGKPRRTIPTFASVGKGLSMLACQPKTSQEVEEEHELKGKLCQQ